MYDINLKNVKKERGIYLIFFIVGIFFLFILGSGYMSSLKLNSTLDKSVMSSKVEVKESRNSDGGTMYSPKYYYEVDGTEYICTSKTSSSIYPSTENKLVKYDSKHPGTCVTAYDKSSNMFLLIGMLIPLLCIGVGISRILKVNNRVKMIEELNKKGKLIKGMPYRMENSGISSNKVPIQRPVVDYTLPSGSIITLHGDPRFDRKSYDRDGLVDLIIDENNPDNYFIDFEINRLSGNLPTDFYVNPNTQNNMNVQPIINQQMPPQQPYYQEQPYTQQQNNNM